ncbi:MAG: hypothetical protein AABO57_09880 [Acidobacteriota bacterium]
MSRLILATAIILLTEPSYATHKPVAADTSAKARQSATGGQPQRAGETSRFQIPMKGVAIEASMVKRYTTKQELIYVVRLRYFFDLMPMGNVSGKENTVYVSLSKPRSSSDRDKLEFLLPRQGRFEFLSVSDKLTIEFREPDRGNIILSFVLMATVGHYYAPPPDFDIPKPSDFASTSRNEPWPFAISFEQAAFALFARKSLDFHPYREGDTTYYATPYIPLSIRSDSLIGQYAILLSYPHVTGGGEKYFRLQYLVR